MSELTLPATSNAGGPEVRLLRRPVTVAPAVVAVVALAFAILPLGHAVVALVIALNGTSPASIWKSITPRL